jgi:hypothetical protein
LHFSSKEITEFALEELKDPEMTMVARPPHPLPHLLSSECNLVHEELSVDWWREWDLLCLESEAQWR